MGLKKRVSEVLDEAKKRLAGLKSIDPFLDLGNGLTVQSYQAAIAQFDALLDQHNQQVAKFNDSKNATDAEENLLLELNRRILAAAGSKFGFDSSEYEMTGGTRTSDIKRSKKPNKNEPDDLSQPGI